MRIAVAASVVCALALSVSCSGSNRVGADGDGGTRGATSASSGGGPDGGGSSSGGGEAASCLPGAQRCAGNGIETCGSTGQWGTEMASPAACTDRACVDGECVGVCAPGSVGCMGNQPQTCDANGTWQSAGPACTQPAPACIAGSCGCPSGAVVSDGVCCSSGLSV